MVTALMDVIGVTPPAAKAPKTGAPSGISLSAGPTRGDLPTPVVDRSVVPADDAIFDGTPRAFINANHCCDHMVSLYFWIWCVYDVAQRSMPQSPCPTRVDFVGQRALIGCGAVISMQQVSTLEFDSCLP